MKSFDFEKNIGIEGYLTTNEGIGGKLRTTPEDFIVKEVFLPPKKKENGSFTIASVYCRNWETNRLIRELSKRLRISRGRIGFAGTKDKRACTTRLMSFYNVPEERLSRVDIKDVVIDVLYYSDKPVRIGDLYGNMFEVTVRDVDMGVGSEQVRDIVSFLESYGGFPNFFGVQRFGVMRPVNHVIGRYIVEGDFERAVMSYVANPVEGEDEEILRLRDDLERSHDFSKALSCYPESLSFEKAVLNKLVVDPRDFVAALKELPRNLLTLFVSAYQSFLFNRMLSERIRRGIPLNRAIVGDIVLPVRKNVIDDVGILVDEFNIEKVNRQVSRGKAFVSGLLVGCDPVFSEGEMGEIEHEVVERERIDVRDFTVPEIPFVSFSGSRRSLLAPLSRIDWRLMDDEFSSDRRSLILKFELRKGCYATSLLREFMKSGDVRNY